MTYLLLVVPPFTVRQGLGDSKRRNVTTRPPMVPSLANQPMALMVRAWTAGSLTGRLHPLCMMCDPGLRRSLEGAIRGRYQEDCHE